MSENHKINSTKINKYKTLHKIKYNNPTALYIVSQLFKKKQIYFIKNYVKENHLDEDLIETLIKQHIKMNLYYPIIVQKNNREKLQLV